MTGAPPPPKPISPTVEPATTPAVASPVEAWPENPNLSVESTIAPPVPARVVPTNYPPPRKQRVPTSLSNIDEEHAQSVADATAPEADVEPIALEEALTLSALDTLKDKLQSERPTLAAAIMNSAKTVSENKLRLTVFGRNDLGMLQDASEMITRTLRTDTSNPSLKLVLAIDESMSAPARIQLTASDALEEMRKLNPLLRQMEEKFGAELDYS